MRHRMQVRHQIVNTGEPFALPGLVMPHSQNFRFALGGSCMRGLELPDPLLNELAQIRATNSRLQTFPKQSDDGLHFFIVRTLRHFPGNFRLLFPDNLQRSRVLHYRSVQAAFPDEAKAVSSLARQRRRSRLWLRSSFRKKLLLASNEVTPYFAPLFGALNHGKLLRCP